MNDQKAVRLDIENAIATVTLNRPEAMNALSQDVWKGLRDIARDIKETPDIRVVIVTGAGTRAFSAGIDLKMVASGGTSGSGGGWTSLCGASSTCSWPSSWEPFSQ